MNKHIVIVGGGISGLTTAYYLLKRVNYLKNNIKISLLEKSERCGGYIQSINDQDFIFDLGPKGFLASGRQTLLLSKELGLWDRIKISCDDSRIRYLWENKKLKAITFKSLISLKLITLNDTKNFLKEYFKHSNPESEDESIADFITRRFSKNILDRFVENIITGIYAGDPKRLSAKAIFPKLTEWESVYGSIFKGFIKHKRVRKSIDSFPREINEINSFKLLSYEGGMEDLSKALVKNLSNHIKTKCYIDNINYQNSKIKILFTHNNEKKQIKADHLIFSTPAFVSSEYLKPLSNELSKLLCQIEYSPINIVSFGYKKLVHSLKGFGFLISRKEKLKILGSIWNDKIFDHFAPKNSNNITAIYGGAMHPEIIKWNEEKIINQTISDLEIVMGIQKKPDIVRVDTYKKGIPQYNLGHLHRLSEIRKYFNLHSNVHLIGNYFNGVGVNDCVNRAYKFAKNFIF